MNKDHLTEQELREALAPFRLEPSLAELGFYASQCQARGLLKAAIPTAWSGDQPAHTGALDHRLAEWIQNGWAAFKLTSGRIAYELTEHISDNGFPFLTQSGAAHLLPALHAVHAAYCRKNNLTASSLADYERALSGLAVPDAGHQPAAKRANRRL